MLVIGIKTLDDHHNDVFQMIHLLDEAIKTNKRESFVPIIMFLEEHCIEHFEEEEQLMTTHNFKYIDEHCLAHNAFREKIKLIRKMYDENIHTTHIAYLIRRFVDQLITHIQTIDVKIKGMKHE